MNNRAPVIEFVVAARLLQPALAIDACHYGGDGHIPGRWSIDIAGRDSDADVVDGYPDRFRLQLWRKVNDDAFDVVSAV